MLDSSTTRITQDVYDTTRLFIDAGRMSGRGDPNSPEALTRVVGLTAAPQGELKDGMLYSSPVRHGRQLDSLPLDPLGVGASVVVGLDGRVTSGPLPASPVSPVDMIRGAGGAPLDYQPRGSTTTIAISNILHALRQTEADEGAVHAASASTTSAAAGRTNRSIAGTHAAASSASASSTGGALSPLSSKPGNVLIHCFAGKSRSTTILLAYLLVAQKWSLDQAYAHVKKCGPTINVRAPCDEAAGRVERAGARVCAIS